MTSQRKGESDLIWATVGRDKERKTESLRERKEGCGASLQRGPSLFFIDSDRLTLTPADDSDRLVDRHRRNDELRLRPHARGHSCFNKHIRENYSSRSMAHLQPRFEYCLPVSVCVSVTAERLKLRSCSGLRRENKTKNTGRIRRGCQLGYYQRWTELPNFFFYNYYLPECCHLSEDIQQYYWQSLLMRYIQWYISY
jgi:hypothetical protein